MLTTGLIVRGFVRCVNTVKLLLLCDQPLAILILDKTKRKEILLSL